MGTMERIRQTSPYALAAFVIIFVGFMVLSDTDMGTLVRQNQDQNTAPIAVVNGDEILYKDFETQVREIIEQRKAQAQAQGQNEDIDETQIRRQHWQSLIDQLLLKQESEKAGIKVSDGEILDVLLENPPDVLKRAFTDSTGRFDRNQYLQLVTNPNVLSDILSRQNVPAEEVQKAVVSWKKDLLNIEKAIREQKLGEHISTLVTTSLSIVPNDFVQQNYLREKSTANYKYLHLDVKSIPDANVKISEEEIKKYYDERKQYFKQEEEKKVKYVRMLITPSPQDSARSRKRITSLMTDLNEQTSPESKDSIFDIKLSEYGGNSTDFQSVNDINPQKLAYLASLEVNGIAGPVLMADGTYFFRLDEKRSGENVVVKASHILIKPDNENDKDSAKKEAEKFFKMAKKDNFAKLAIEHSKDPGSGQNGGDLGWFGKGSMVKEFEEAAFGAQPGQIVGPIETSFGFHIIKIEDKKSDEYKYSEISIKPMLSNASKNQLFREAYSFKKQVEEGANFDSIAAKLNARSLESPYFPKGQPLLGSQYLSDMAFDSEIGTVLDPLEINGNAIVIAQVAEYKQAGVKSLEDMKPQIENTLRIRKKLDMLKKDAEDTYSRAKNLNDLNEAGAIGLKGEYKSMDNALNNGAVIGGGIDFVLTTKIFEVPLNKISGPFRGEQGWYIIQVNDRKIPSSDDMKKEIGDFKTNYMNNQRQNLFYTWFAQVRKDAKIDDFRKKFYREY